MRPEVQSQTQLQRLIEGGRHAEARQLLNQLLTHGSEDAALWRAALRLAVTGGQMEQALQASRRVTELDPRDAVAWAQQGSLEQLVGRLDLAERALRRAVELLPDGAHLVKLATVMRQLGREADALPLLRQATGLRADLAPAWQQRAECALALGQHVEAEEALRKALLVAPERAASRHQLGLALLGQQRLEEACDAFEAAYQKDRHHYGALAQSIGLRFRLHRWEGLDPLLSELRSAVATGIPGFPAALCALDRDDPQQQLQAAQRQSEHLLRSLRRDYPDGLARSSRPLAERPRVALLWVGQAPRAFRRQLAGLLAQLPEQGPRWLLYSDAATAPELLSQPPLSCEDCFDIGDWSLDRLVHQMIEREVDILLDAGGWTEGARPEVAALRPASLQLAWLGHGGSSGAPWIDYLIGDRHVLEAAERAAYQEHWLQLPHCHLPADRTPQLSQLPERRALGLPRESFVFLNVGGREKLNPDLWSAWLEILREVPESCLGLRSSPALHTADQRLRQSAEAAGIDPERVCFLQWGAEAERLQLLRLADLYLDSWPSGARASGADALWAGLPVLSRVGRSFGARIVGSQLASLGLEELLADNRARYIDLAILIARSPDLHAELRGKLAARKASSPLFDQARFGTDLSQALMLAWRRHCEGLPAADMAVPH